MTSVKKIDDLTYEQVNKRGGKVMTTSRVVYAKDFKSRTITTKGTNPARPARSVDRLSAGCEAERRSMEPA